MKKRCLRLLSCIFIIAMFFGGLCFYNVQTALTEISYETEADFHDFQLITTPKSSINDYRPCTSEMLGNQTAFTSENVLPRMGTRLLVRSIAAVILHNNFNIDNFYHIYSLIILWISIHLIQRLLLIISIKRTVQNNYLKVNSYNMQ